jgi:hypothetical protein
MPGLIRSALFALVAASVGILAVVGGSGCGRAVETSSSHSPLAVSSSQPPREDDGDVRVFTEAGIDGAVGYDGHVYGCVDQIAVHSGVPAGLTETGGRAYDLYGDGPVYEGEKSDPGWVVYGISGKPTRIALQNSWGGGFTFFNIYELKPKAKWKQ